MKILPLLVLASASSLLFNASCSSSDSPASPTGAPGGPVLGVEDAHCAGHPPVAVDPAACHGDSPEEGEGGASGGDEGEGGVGGSDCNQTHDAEYGDTLPNSEGDDDDCKYHVSWTSTPIRRNQDATFTVTTKDLATDQPLESLADHELPLSRVEVYQPCEPNRLGPAQNAKAEFEETAPGYTKAGHFASTNRGVGSCASTSTNNATTASDRRTGTSPSSSTCRDPLTRGYSGPPQANQSRICCRSLLLSGGEPDGGMEQVASLRSDAHALARHVCVVAQQATLLDSTWHVARGTAAVQKLGNPAIEGQRVCRTAQLCWSGAGLLGSGLTARRCAGNEQRKQQLTGHLPDRHACSLGSLGLSRRALPASRKRRGECTSASGRAHTTRQRSSNGTGFELVEFSTSTRRRARFATSPTEPTDNPSELRTPAAPVET